MATPVFNLRFNVTNVTSSSFGGAAYKLTGFVFDESNNFDGTNAELQDFVFDFNGNKYKILNFVTQTSSQLEVDVQDLDSQTPITGNAVVSRPSSNYGFAIGSRQTNGVAEYLNNYINSATLQQIDSKIYNTNTFVEIITISGTDISNGYTVLSNTPTTSKAITAQVVGGPLQTNTIDFTVTGNQLTWSGDFAATIEESDILVVSYNLE